MLETYRDIELCCVRRAAENHLSASVQRQRCGGRGPGGGRLRRVGRGAERRRAHEGRLLPALLGHREERGEGSMGAEVKALIVVLLCKC